LARRRLRLATDVLQVFSMTCHRVAAGIGVLSASLAFAQTTPVINQGGVVRGADNYDASFNAVARGALPSEPNIQVDLVLVLTSIQIMEPISPKQ
jgi:hypothetical protein